jgi:hypothetical protein
VGVERDAWLGLGLGTGLGFGLLGDGSEGHLRGVKELGAGFGLDGAEEDSEANAGDEVADVLIARERGQGHAEGCISAALGVAQGVSCVQGCAESRCPDLGAPFDGGVLEGDEEVFFHDRCISEWDGFEQDFLREGEIWLSRIDCAPWDGNYLQ